MIWQTMLLNLAFAASVDGVPRLGNILPQKFCEEVSIIMSEGTLGSNCTFPGKEKLEKDYEEKSAAYFYKQKEYFRKHPEIRDAQALLGMYPELQKLFADKNKATDARNIGVGKYDQCLASYMKTRTVEGFYEIYSEPSLKSKKLGRLRFRYGSPQDLTVTFVDSNGSERNFKIDVDYADSGIVEHTILEERGPWAKLPKEPFDTPVWLYRHDRKEGDSRELHRYSRLNVFTKTYTGKVTLERVEGEFYIGLAIPDEPANENDSCDVEPDADLKNAKPIKIPLKEFFDSNGHVRAKPADLIC